MLHQKVTLKVVLDLTDRVVANMDELVGKLPFLVVPPDHCLYGEQIHHWLEKHVSDIKMLRQWPLFN
jgi:hypothetical protein